MIIFANLAALLIGSILFGKTVFSMIKSYQTARNEGILKIQICRNILYFVSQAFFIIVMIWAIGVHLHNKDVYLTRAELTRKYGIEWVVEAFGFSDNILKNGAVAEERYIAYCEDHAKDEGWAVAREIGWIMLIMSITVNPAGGYVTREGWRFLAGQRTMPLTIHTEGGELRFYLEGGDAPIVKVKDTPENRETFALLIPDEGVES